MRSIKIGTLLITPRAIGIIAIGFFCFGVLLGAHIALAIDTGKNLSVISILLFPLPVWIILYPLLKKEMKKN